MIKKTNNTIQAVWVGVGSLSSLLLALLSSAILSRYFNKTEYGTYRQIIYIYSTLLVVFSAGLPSVFSYFLPRYNLAKGRDVVWKITKLLIFCGFIFTLFLYLSSDLIALFFKNQDMAIGLKYFSLVPLFMLPSLGVEGIFSTYKKTFFLAMYNVLTRIIMLLCIVLPVILFKGNCLYAIYGWLASSAFTFFLALYFKSIPFKGVKPEHSFLSLNEIFNYSLPLVFSSLAGILIKTADSFYISRYFGPESFALFSNGFIEIPFVGMVTSATSMVLMPVFSKIIHEKGDLNELSAIWRSALDKSAIVVYPMVVFFLFNATHVVIFLFSSEYLDAAPFFRLAIMMNFFNIIIFAPLILALGKVKLYTWVHIILAIAAWLGDLLIVYYFNDPFIVAFWSVVLTIIKTIYFFFYISKSLKISLLQLFPYKNAGKVVIHSFLIAFIVKYGLQLFYPTIDNISFLLISSFLFGVLLLISGKLFKLNYLSVLIPLIKKEK